MRTPIATRTLHIGSDAGTLDVPVKVFAPEEADGAWRCRYEIGWPESASAGAAFGADAIQALLLGLQKIGAELHASDHHHAGRLVWTEPGQGYGFPVSRTIRDLLTDLDQDL